MSVYKSCSKRFSKYIVRLCASETLARCTERSAFGTQRSGLAYRYVFLSRPNHTCKRVLMAVSGVHCRELALPITNEHSE